MDAKALLYAVSLLILIYMVILNAIYTLNLVMAAVIIPSRNKRYRITKGVSRGPATTKAISILVPAYNEEKTIVESINALLALNYQDYEIIIANDGSTDDTLELLISTFHFERVEFAPNDAFESKPIRTVYFSKLEPKLVLVDKENGGKADSQNAAARVSRSPYVLMVDADTLLDEESLQNFAVRFTAAPKTAALGGIVRVVNGCTVVKGVVTNVAMPHRFIERVQVLEYLRAFLFGRISFSSMNALLIISGAFGVFRWDAFMRLGGWNREAIGEDMDAVVRLHRAIHEQGLDWRVDFAPSPVSWTQVPLTWKSLGSQRDRWQRGLMQVTFENMRLMFNPKYGAVGLVGFPYFAIFEMLSAMIEFLCYPLTLLGFSLGVLNATYVFFFIGLVMIWGLCVSFATVLVHEFVRHRYANPGDLGKMLWVAVLENFGFRQIHSYWRLRGIIKYLFNKSARTTGLSGWEAIERSGF